MRISYGAGVVIVILAPFVLFFFKTLDLNETLFLVFAMWGLWTIAEAFSFLSDNLELTRYLISGVLLAAISTAFILPLTYAAALILVGIIISVIIISVRINSKKKDTVPKAHEEQ